MAAKNGSNVKKLDSLILNAGIMAAPYELSKQNHESHFQVNHLAHFLMYENLKPALFANESASKGRVFGVVFIGDDGELSLDVNDLDFKNRKYDKWYAYGQSKACNILFADDLAKKIAYRNWSRVVSPGNSDRSLVRYSFPDLSPPNATRNANDGFANRREGLAYATQTKGVRRTCGWQRKMPL